MDTDAAGNRSLVIDMEEAESLLVMLPGQSGEKNVVRLTMLHKSGRRARIRVLAGADVLIHRSIDRGNKPSR